MIGFCGYNFCYDKDSLNPFPTNTKNIKNVKIENAIYDSINISRDVLSNYSTDIPVWDFNTILNTDFSDGIGAGNVSFTISQLSSIKIKRRKKNSFNWITIQESKVDSESDIDLIKLDYLVPSNEEFEWAVVPVLNGVEGEYIVGSLRTEFDGIFITDSTNSFKLYNGVSYGNKTNNQMIGQIIALGRKYPMIIRNGVTEYESGSISGLFLGKNYEETHEINRKDIVEQINEFTEFLNNGKPKVIKDWNGNIHICQISSSPTISYNNNYGMGVASVSFEWVEQGKYDNENDLYENGFIENNT